MTHHRFRRGCLAVASLAALSALPGEGHAQTACRAGPLSAYLQTSGLGCSMGQTRLMQFTASGLGSQAGNVWLDPFTLQGPPGYTWVGFHVRFTPGTQFASNAPLGLSFWADGVPLYGVMGYNTMAAGSAGTSMEGGTRMTLTGDGGGRQVVDRTELMRQGNAMRVVRGCGWTTAAARVCVAGDTTASNGLLADADLRYSVAAQSIMGAGASGQPYDFTVAVLTDQAVITPEPATLVLLSTGLAGIGALARRRRKDTSS